MVKHDDTQDLRGQDVIDSRDVIARLDWLNGEIDAQKEEQTRFRMVQMRF